MAPRLTYFSLALLGLLVACSDSDASPPVENGGGAGIAGASGQTTGGLGGDAGSTTQAGASGEKSDAGQGGSTTAGQGGDEQGGSEQGGAGQGGSTTAGVGGEAGQGGSTTAGAGGEAGQGGSTTAGQGGEAGQGGSTTAGAGGEAGQGGSTTAGAGGEAGSGGCGTPMECAAQWEQNAVARFNNALGDKDDLILFLSDMPKGADLHNHLSGAVYAETYLEWAKTEKVCINNSTFVAALSSQCSSGSQPVPGLGLFYDEIVRAWSMLDFVPGVQSGHDHFFATFGKFGVIAGMHRDDSIADVLQRAASENVQHVETMFNTGKNVGTLAASLFSGTVTKDKLAGFYDSLLSDPSFASNLTKDVKVVEDAASKYQSVLGCSKSGAPDACKVSVRFVAQVSRTGANDQIFGQLVAAFEIAAKTPYLVGVNLSSPEDDTASLKNYTLHMQMLDLLHEKYTLTGKSPIHVTLHAGELVPKFLPSGYPTANTFHIQQAVELGHAERIGHGIDILSETGSSELLAQMAQKKILVEVCLSSNAQILEVSGAAHPLATYMQNGVPVALATDDQGVSRSSMMGEFFRGAQDQQLTYLQLKRMARNSLEHAFLPGESLWSSLESVTSNSNCKPTATMGLGDSPNAMCKLFLKKSERATMQWEMERRFRVFESQQLLLCKLKKLVF